jgi:hypothetical protein
MPKPIKSEKDIKVGDFFEDCAYHPCLCIALSPEGDPDGVLTVEEAIQWKFHGPADEKLKPEERWWTT